jgi:homoserine dehydrogenase
MAPLRVGLAGLGTVGSAVVKMLAQSREQLAERAGRPIELAAYTSKDPPKDKGIDLSKARKLDDPIGLASDSGIDVFVELMGGEGDPAKRAVETALNAGRAVITANKALIARHGNLLAKLAEQKNASFSFEASVGGGIPVVKTLREGLGGAHISRVYGILNGTCNYILTQMQQEHRSFADCLKDAQRLGYAEADPTFDVGGFDTAHKIAILTSLAFGTEIDADSVHVEGIETISLADLQAADHLGYKVKLLGVASRTDGGIEQRVHPTMVPKASTIGGVDGVLNAVAINSDMMDLTLVGPGAGGPATSSAVVADLVDFARGRLSPPLGRAAARLAKSKQAPIQRHEGGYYIRLAALDRPGTMAAISKAMAAENISLESIVQRHENARPHGGDDPKSAAGPAPVILITYATNEDAVRRALAAIEREGVVAERPQLIRIEKS